jgi:hypothetical protein
MDRPIYAFDKLDGSNIRAEWSKKRGFYKFGKRHGLVDETDPMLGEAKGLVLEGAEALARILTDNRWQQSVCFFEFHGPNSFAGSHADEPHQVTLIDVAVDKRGILDPRDFLKHFADKVPTAPLLYQGNPNQPFLESVRSGQLEGMTFEGVICKGGLVSPGRPLMFKVKNRAWVDRVKGKFADRPDLIEKLL